MHVLTTTATASSQGHTKVIQALGWNCDGKKLATASAASDVRVWNVESHREGKEQVLEDHKSSVEGLSWNPTNPDVLATGSADKAIRLFDLRAKKSLKIDTPDDVLNVAYSADGDYIVMSDKSENLRLVDVRSGKNKIIASAAYDKEYWVNELAWHGKDSLLMCAGRQKADAQEKGMVELIQLDWSQGGDAGSLRSVASMVAHTANCTNISIDAQGDHFATGAYDGTVCLWDAHELACLRPACTALEESVGCLSFSHDGNLIAATSEPEGRAPKREAFIDISAVSTGETLLKMPISAHAKKIAWHPSQHILAFGGEKVVVQDERRSSYGEQSSRSEVPLTFVSLKVT